MGGRRNEREGILEEHAETRAALAGAELIEPTRPRRHVLVDWRPDDEGFWATTGRRIAHRNLMVSMPALLLAFAVWLVWSVSWSSCRASGSSPRPTSCSGWRRCPALGRGVPRALFVRRAHLRRAQLDRVEHDDAAAADAMDRLRRAGPEHQLRRVRRDRAAVRPGRRQLLVVDGAYQLSLSEAAAGHGARRKRGNGQPGRRAGAAHRAARHVWWRSADHGRQPADPRGRRARRCRSGCRTPASSGCR